MDGNWRCTGAEEIPCEQVREWCILGWGFRQSSSDPGGREWELRERERKRERERVRESAGWGGGSRESKVSAGSTPDPSHSTKMVGKMPLIKKAHKKTLTSETKV
jgi:hypothetical protein